MNCTVPLTINPKIVTSNTITTATTSATTAKPKRKRIRAPVLHRPECPFEGCKQTFSTSGHLARHMKIHTGTKPHSCPIEGCDKSFSRKDNMIHHFNNHKKKLGPRYKLATNAPSNPAVAPSKVPTAFSWNPLFSNNRAQNKAPVYLGNQKMQGGFHQPQSQQQQQQPLYQSNVQYYFPTLPSAAVQSIQQPLFHIDTTCKSTVPRPSITSAPPASSVQRNSDTVSGYPSPFLSGGDKAHFDSSAMNHSFSFNDDYASFSCTSSSSTKSPDLLHALGLSNDHPYPTPIMPDGTSAAGPQQGVYDFEFGDHFGRKRSFSLELWTDNMDGFGFLPGLDRPSSC